MIGRHEWAVTAKQPSLQGKVALVTGANSGLGFETACGLAMRGARLLLPVRNNARGLVAVENLKTRCPTAEVDLLTLDLTSLESVAACAAVVAHHTNRLDFLINNAGVMAPARRKETQDGFELQFGTNHLGHFALTYHLRPLLEAAAGGGVVVTVASLAACKGSIHFDDLQFRHRYSPFGAYQQSKLANLLFARELARRAGNAGWKLHSRAAHPGWSSTSIVANGPASGLPGPIGKVEETLGGVVLRIMGQSAARGAEPLLYAALSPAARDGDYYGPQGRAERRGLPGPAHVPPEALKASTAERLWDVSERLTGLGW
ncbi:SDR family NAD(P)-dependent oxidoreductase [Acetobacter tropicalis]|uniref:Oxidoreductase n=1 Tax=Acetobacter tropicalis TaxID=104102 RepID=A0A094YMK4_9PROT|nr:SDR family oxidoreductase [Acetobacter tropicalis]KAA8390733.1 SDR family NAD(P)-dependent oxidoreductase [Acetobacter tropicalis]KAA8393202.1 SDR family NAD(P)-dependent oxidoreductase [Acetobacter tropicalis]KGB22602.1 putative oxidoreductase/Short-chain dehydrogenase [Acetobacter tropicalis]KXV57854.1 oxidoreductase [Acetobacter tropicalis]MBC9007311.1 SDR family oxidoreductase [Acetobacter tropicalis]